MGLTVENRTRLLSKAVWGPNSRTSPPNFWCPVSFMAVCFGASDLKSLGLQFLPCKLGGRGLSKPPGLLRSKQDSPPRALSAVQDTH